MQNLLDFLARHFHWLVFLLLETASGILLFRYNSYQGSVWLSTANAVAGKVLETQARVEHYFSLQRINEELSQRNIVLEQRVQLLNEKLEMRNEKLGIDEKLEMRNEKYDYKANDLSADTPADTSADTPADTSNHISHFSPLISHFSPLISHFSPLISHFSPLISHLDMIPAKVVGNTVNRRDNFITIDRGRNDGVMPDMGVVSGLGVVGVVYLAGDHYATVLPVLNSHSRISCAIRGHEYFGYLSWQGGSPVEADVEDIPRHARFKKGDWVETSGYSAIFPKGVCVGKITGIYNSADGLSYSLKVHLATDFACLRDVYVITDTNLLEQRKLMESATDSLAQY